ncbi:DNA internalization-related competence protein ComEC/Rec2 [Salipaludibacillus neizhouensis]|uniref:DNA internalization-related competence protein ComEC/Rec2 n=1 Tax=Salipaludibacillus neizhouensis TaxID=885475 RepID=A0A3A9KDT1_9BACI|nr:DNA internalization-related competence protein ComEC/Rec2 [Salipaludibacillus neizhouensis]RKL68651.1 DNA internalization-related competence protein ComEC/Rec2 [Salipaludibacillus neizhouensis]
MFSRSYCFMFFAISGLLLAFDGWNLWSAGFLVLGCFPFVVYGVKRKNFLSAVVSVLVLSIFYLYGLYHLETMSTRLTGEEANFKGKIVSNVKQSTSGGYSFQVLLDNGEKILLSYRQENDLETIPNKYDYCNFTGELEIPPPSKNPYTFNYKKYLYEQHIHWRMTVNENTLVCDAGEGLLKWLDSGRSKAVHKIVQKDDLETSALISALVFGERSYMNEERLEQFRQLGVLHLLAVSGLHVGIVTAFIFNILLRIGLTKEKASLIVFFFLPFYIFVAGGAPSVVRASFMCMLFLVITRYRINLKGIDVISFVCLVLLIIDPFYLYHLGFQLSFLTSFGLLLSSKVFNETSPITLLFKVTVTAQIISMPLFLYHSFDFSVLTIPANLVFIPFISMWILPLSFITVILDAVIPPLALVTYNLLSISTHLIQLVLDFVSTLSWSVIALGKPPEWMLWSMYISIFIGMVLIEKKQTFIRVLGGTIMLLPFIIQFLMPYMNEDITVTMLDVGQGDAIVVELPHREAVYLIDTGGVVHWGEQDESVSPKGPGAYVIEPFLKAKGIKEIDLLIMSHGHLDHIGETCYVSEKFLIKEALYPKGTPISEEGRGSLECLFNDKVEITLAEKGMNWSVGKNSFYIFHPSGTENTENENERSIVVYAVLAGRTMLFEGDLEEDGETELLENYPDITVDLLKVSHHGSNTSSGEALLSQLKPAYGFISAGENNRHGHPSAEVLERFASHKTKVFRTDKQGAIVIKINNGIINVTPFLP